MIRNPRLFHIARLAALVLLILSASTFGHHRLARGQASARALQAGTEEPMVASPDVDLPPVVAPAASTGAIARQLSLKTRIPKRASEKVTDYTVEAGDSPWSIAKDFNLKPESILWANEKLSASAGSLKPGMVLKIPPVDGVIHTVRDGDTLEALQTLHGTSAQDIFEYPGNNFDLTEPPKLVAGQQVIIPGGTSDVAWQDTGPNLTVVSRAGSSAVPLVMTGSGYFMWPIAPPIIITQPFWGGHGGIDIDTYPRQPVFAADSGTVVFSGWDDTGYGFFVIIDHGNGYETTYGHNTATLVSAGQAVVKGQQIAESGSTGNSTGDHLDFRILYNGVALDPAGFLP